MNIPKELKSYYIKPSKFTLNLLKNNINRIGFDKYFEEQLDCFLNCARVWKTGERPVMTTYMTYIYEMSNTLAMIEEYAENKDYYIEQLINKHNNNLEFETNNPYDYKPSKVKRSNPRRKDYEQLTMDGIEVKPKKETAAERKLKQSALKLNKLSFNLKPAQQ